MSRVIIETLVEGTDLYREIARIAAQNKVSAGRVTGSGSVQRARITTCDQKTMQHATVEVSAPMEIVSLYGEVLAHEGKVAPHIHVVLADDRGNGNGGHLTPDSTPVRSCEIKIEEYATDGTEGSVDIRGRLKNQLQDPIVG